MFKRKIGAYVAWVQNKIHVGPEFLWKHCYDAYDVPQLQQLKVVWERQRTSTWSMFLSDRIHLCIDILGYGI
jgi:hypothetical protein